MYEDIPQSTKDDIMMTALWPGMIVWAQNWRDTGMLQIPEGLTRPEPDEKLRKAFEFCVETENHDKILIWWLNYLRELPCNKEIEAMSLPAFDQDND